MAVLSNPKHEQFAQGLAKGLTADEAYVAAGFKESRGNASRLRSNENISKRVEEIVSRGAERAEVTVAKVMAELSRLGFSDVRNAFTPEGAIRNPNEWDDDFARSVAAIEVVTRATGERDENDRPIIENVHKIKLWDKNSALEKLAKALGMFVEKHEHSGAISLNVTPDDARL